MGLRRLSGIHDAAGTTYSWFMIDENPIRTRYQAVRPSLDERGRRLHAAAEAVTAGHGGIAATSRATKVARSTIGRGLKDLREPGSLTGSAGKAPTGTSAARAEDRDAMMPEKLTAAVAPAGLRPMRVVELPPFRHSGSHPSRRSAPQQLGVAWECSNGRPISRSSHAPGRSVGRQPSCDTCDECDAFCR